MPTSAVPSGCLAGGGVGSGGDSGGLGALEQPQLALCLAPILVAKKNLDKRWILRGLPLQYSTLSDYASGELSRVLSGNLPLYDVGARDLGCGVSKSGF